MGIDILIRTYAKESWAHQAFIGVGEAASKLLPGYVKIDDCLTRLTNLLGPRYDNIVSSLEFYELFITPIRLAFNRDRVRVYVAIFDDEENKSDRKKNLHPKRDGTLRSKAVKADKGEGKDENERYVPVPYPSTTRIVENGVYDIVTKKSALLDLRRFRVSRHLRIHMYKFFQKLITTEAFIQNDRLLIFEYSKAGPTLYPGMMAWPSDMPIPKALAHNHGEADPSIAFWASLFREKQVSVVSIDTDVIPILSLMIGNRKKGNDIFWFYGSETAVDMRKFLEQILKSTGLDAFQFALFCILCKTDYVDKGLYARGFGCLPILDACMKTKENLQLFVNAARQGYSKTSLAAAESTLEVFVRCLCDRGRNKALMQRIRVLRPNRPSHEESFEQSSSSSSSSSAPSDSSEYKCIQASNIEAYKMLISGETRDAVKSTGKALLNNVDDAVEANAVKKGKKRKITDLMNEEIEREEGKNEVSTKVVKHMIAPSLSSIRKIYATFKKYSIPTSESITIASEQIMWNWALWQEQGTYICQAIKS